MLLGSQQKVTTQEENIPTRIQRTDIVQLDRIKKRYIYEIHISGI